MSHELIGSASFHLGLLALDDQIAAKHALGRCARCGGALHVANYPRQPRGVPDDLGPEYSLRKSFCCSGRDCRERHTPPSVRFLDRRVYSSIAVILAMVLIQGPAGHRLTAIQIQLGIGRRTLSRWREWWRNEFPLTSTWTELRGRLDRPCDLALLPLSLLERIAAPDDEQRLLRLLNLLRPLSHSALMRTRFSRAS